jgi:hypothetical protein
MGGGHDCTGTGDPVTPPRGRWDPGEGCQRHTLLSKRRDFLFASHVAGEVILTVEGGPGGVGANPGIGSGGSRRGQHLPRRRVT